MSCLARFWLSFIRCSALAQSLPWPCSVLSVLSLLIANAVTMATFWVLFNVNPLPLEYLHAWWPLLLGKPNRICSLAWCYLPVIATGNDPFFPLDIVEQMQQRQPFLVRDHGVVNVTSETWLVVSLQTSFHPPFRICICCACHVRPVLDFSDGSDSKVRTPCKYYYLLEL